MQGTLCGSFDKHMNHRLVLQLNDKFEMNIVMYHSFINILTKEEAWTFAGLFVGRTRM